MTCFENAIRTDPSSPLPYINQALIALQFQNDADKAEVFLKKAIEVDPVCDIAYSHLGQVLLTLNKTDEALKVYEKAVLLFFIIV